MQNILQQDIQYLPGVGPSRKKMLNEELGITCYGDLLKYFPYKHVDRSRLYSIRELTGDSATSHIRRFIMQRAQQLLISGATISETAERLGFDYTQHFTRQFKKHFGVTPSDFMRRNFDCYG